MIVCGTGHRPNKVGGYGPAAHIRLVKLAKDWLRANHPYKVISGMALGWDQAIAQAAKEMAYPYIAAIPFNGQENAWPTESKHKYYELMDEANEIVVVCEGGYAPWKMQDRNKWMVDNSDVVLALWDGSSGGTANCVKYAEAKQKLLINLWETYALNGT